MQPSVLPVRIACIVVLAFLLLPTVPTPSVLAEAPAWAEPRALNIVDIAGQVRDEVLHDVAITSNGAAGVAQFVSSEIEGDLLRITARVYARRMWNGATGEWSTKVPLLGQRPCFDHMGSSAPEAWVQLYENGRPLTVQQAWIEYLEPEVTLPLAGAAEPWRRYRETMISGVPLRVDADGIYLPANYGGELGFSGDHPVLTAVYTVRLAERPRVSYLATQEAKFQTYIGPGGVGLFAPLMEQMSEQYDDRHGRIPLSIPTGANYVLFQYPLIPFYVYDEDNLLRPSTGSVRLSPAETAMLSADLVHGGGFPLQAAWQDAGQVKWSDEDRNQPDRPYSERFLTRLGPIAYVAPPEYVVPAGMAYNVCFRNGGCPSSLLDDIHDAHMTLRVVYLRVEPPTTGTFCVPLRMAGDSWEPLATAPQASLAQAGGFAMFLPFVRQEGQTQVSRDAPLGVFDVETGRMMGYLP